MSSYAFLTSSREHTSWTVTLSKHTQLERASSQLHRLPHPELPRSPEHVAPERPKVVLADLRREDLGDCVVAQRGDEVDVLAKYVASRRRGNGRHRASARPHRRRSVSAWDEPQPLAAGPRVELAYDLVARGDCTQGRGRGRGQLANVEGGRDPVRRARRRAGSLPRRKGDQARDLYNEGARWCMMDREQDVRAGRVHAARTGLERHLPPGAVSSRAAGPGRGPTTSPPEGRPPPPPAPERARRATWRSPRA